MDKTSDKNIGKTKKENNIQACRKSTGREKTILFDSMDKKFDRVHQSVICGIEKSFVAEPERTFQRHGSCSVDYF
jgi:hypothetical protein